MIRRVILASALMLVADSAFAQVTAPQAPGSNLPIFVNGGTLTANQGGAPWTFNQTQVASTTIATPTTFGTAVLGPTPGVNAAIFGQYLASPGSLTNGQVYGARLDINANLLTVSSEAGSAAPTIGISPVTTQAGTTTTAKTSAGNLYSAYAVNQTTTAGYLVCVNSAATITGAITPVDVAYLSGAVGATAQINYGAGPPNAYSTGIACGVTTSLTTYTAGGNAFIQVRYR